MADWIVDPADSEMQRQSLEDILLLSCRIDDVELVKALSLFRQKAHNVTSDSRTRTQLFDSMRELSDAYDAAMEVISEKLKDCLGVAEPDEWGRGAFALDEFWSVRPCGSCYIGFRNVEKASFHPILCDRLRRLG